MKSSCWLDESLSSTTNVLFQRIYQVLKEWYAQLRNLIQHSDLLQYNLHATKLRYLDTTKHNQDRRTNSIKLQDTCITTTVLALLADALFMMDTLNETYLALLLPHQQLLQYQCHHSPTQQVKYGSLICPPLPTPKHRKPFWPGGLILPLSPSALQGRLTSQ